MFLALAAALAAAATAPASAQSRIGAATEVRNQVSTFRKGTAVRLDQGSSVFRSEAVSTGRDSAARLTFLDDTNLAIGPSSRVVLDEFVFSPARSAQALTINLARGAFRFSTGRLDKRAYKIRTSTATIGVRGTVLDIFSVAGRTLVTLVDNGAALLCVTGTRTCQELTVQGQTFQVDPGGVRRVTVNRSRFTFNRYCSGNICRRTRLAGREGNDQPLPFPRIAQPISDPIAGCNSGSCTPQVSEVLQPTAGVVTGIALSGTSGALILEDLDLPASVKAPLTGGEIISAPIIPVETANVVIQSDGNLVTQVVVDPGFKYTAWGEWAGTITVTENDPIYSSQTITATRGFAVFGNATPSDVIMAKTGTATYTGPVLADLIVAGNTGMAVVQPGAIGGTLSLTANFTEKTVSGSLALTKNNTPWATPVFAGIPMEFGRNVGTATGAGYRGPISDPYNASSSGEINGVFMGPAGEETAGSFSFLKASGANPGIAHGIIRGKQGGM
ncbi:MAG: FecR domain-containing protein [Hyphomicrobiales bacterium]|nr:FecR domain-containing protein [Hyphomicrobiales bacterium]